MFFELAGRHSPSAKKNIINAVADNIFNAFGSLIIFLKKKKNT